MTAKQYYLAVSEAHNYADIDAFISGPALGSEFWGDPEDSKEIPLARREDLREIWEAAHRSFKDILSAAGITQARFLTRFCISRRTVCSWYNGERQCAIYDRLMFQQLLGILDIEISDP